MPTRICGKLWIKDPEETNGKPRLDRSLVAALFVNVAPQHAFRRADQRRAR